MKLKSMAVAASLALTAAIAQGEIVIDNFNDPFSAPGQTVKSDTNGVVDSDTDTGLTGVLGGSRSLSVECVSGCTTGSSRNATLAVELGELAWNNAAGVRSVATTRWDANGAGLGFNALAAGNSIVASIIEADLGFNYILTLSTGAGQRTELSSGTVNAVIDDGSSEDAFYDLSWFTLANGSYFLGGLPFKITNFGGGVDLTNVNSITLELSNNGICFVPGTDDCSTAVDLRIDEAKVVPEPGSIALVGLGLLGVAAMRRRIKA